jgi:hypothetical protein
MMAHTLRKVNLGNSALAQVVITDYVQGGEAFTLAEFGLTGPLTGVDFLAIIGQNSNITPVFVTPNLVKLLLPSPAIAATLGPEQSTTSGLNYKFIAIVTGT